MRWVGGAIIVVLVAAAWAPAPSTAADARDPSPYRRLVTAVESDLVAHPEIPGEAVSVRAASLDIAAARGYADVATKAPLRVETPFRIASVTKTFVAAAVLRLVEQGKVALDGPIAPYLAPETIVLLVRGGYAVDHITVRELLDHRAGLFDYATSEAYDNANVQDPGHHWTRAEQLTFAVNLGRPVAAPGETYHYSDTGYLLLGEILERASGHSLATAVRDAIGFRVLGLDHTYWEQLEPPPPDAPARAHQYYATTFDNIALDASADLYGGGGLISTVGDLTRFFRALFDGQVFSDNRTLDSMLTVSRPGREEGVGLGIFATRIAGERCWGHPGYWGTVAYYCPKADVAFAIATNQADEAKIDTIAVERTIMHLARRASRPDRVVLMGDSLTAFNGTRVEMLLGTGYRAVNAGVGGTSLLDANVCDGSRARRLVKQYAPDVVVIEYTGNYGQLNESGVPECDPPVRYGSTEFIRAWRRAAELNQRLFLAKGVRVFWVISPMPRDTERHDVPRLNEVYRSVAAEGAGLVNAWTPFGGDRYRADLHDDDGLHLNSEGNELFAEVIAATVSGHDSSVGASATDAASSSGPGSIDRAPRRLERTVRPGSADLDPLRD